MVINYDYDGKYYRLQLWKGSYGFGNAYGAEVGLYYNTSGGEWYKTVRGKDEIRMEQYVKDKNGNVLIHNDTADYAKNQDHYWNLAIRSSRGYNKNNLVQESYITIKDAKQRNQLIKELQSRKDVNFSICGDGRIKIIDQGIGLFLEPSSPKFHNVSLLIGLDKGIAARVGCGNLLTVCEK